MNQEMYDLAARAVKMATAAGANDCRARIQNERFVEVGYRQRQPENIKEASTRNLLIQIFANGRYSSQSTSDLRPEALRQFIENAVKTTRLLAEDPYRSLPEAQYYQGRSNIDLKIVDQDYGSISAEDRHTLVKTIEANALASGGTSVLSVSAQAHDSRLESVVLTSNGFEGYAEKTVFWAGAEMTIQDQGDRRPNGYYFVAGVNRETLPKPEIIGVNAAKATLDLLGAKKINTETLPIIVENQQVSTLLSGLLDAMYGRAIQQKQSFLADKKGQKIASPYLTLIDDPFVNGGLGSRLYDSDGISAQKRIMIDAGILKEFYVDWYYSRKLGWQPTTGSPSNLIIPPGKRTVSEIMKDLGRGILITGFIGGNSNPTTGDASIGIMGKLFENGEPIQSVAEMNIAGNHMEFWQHLSEVANDPWIYSSQRFPSLIFTDMVVAGI